MRNTLECITLSKSFGQTSALRAASLNVSSGNLTALLGPSGCGKTTLLRLIAGFEQPDSGQVIINGQTVASSNQMIPAEKRRVGMVFQEYALFQHLSISGNVAFGLIGSGREKRRRVSEILKMVGLAGFEDRMPHELSGGQQQRVALARALAPEPSILLLDEPFSNLDAALRNHVRAEVKNILATIGTTCVFVTHDQEEALSLADEVAVMLDGHVLQVAAPQMLYHQPTSKHVASFVGESNFFDGHAHGNSVTCKLGRLPLHTPATGNVEVLIRPEALTLAPANGTGNARITWVEFYGHDQRIGIAFHDGTNCIARLGPADSFTVGQQVKVSAVAPVIAFPPSSAN
jgi:iron(III) transport system ATP-binding protein